eukprot:25540_1
MSASFLLVLCPILIEFSSAVTKQYRLPPQVAYAGKETRIHLGKHFESEHDADLSYLIAMYDDDVNPPKKISTLPDWVEWDESIPSLHINAPANLSDINPVYEFRIMAMVENNKEEMAEEKVIVVIAHSCFNKCPKHFGIGCEDWDLYMTAAGVYGVIMLITGCIAHCIIGTAHEWVMNRDRKRRVDDDRMGRRIEYARLKKFENVSDDEMNHWSSDDDDVWRPHGKPKEFNCTKCTKRWLWICWINCCCFKTDRFMK